MYTYPLEQVKITQSFGSDPDYYKQWGLKGHHGIDMRAVMKTPGAAVADGEIIAAQDGINDEFTGNYISGLVCILRTKGYDWWYLHCNGFLVKPGQHVKAGQQIIETGNTGASTAPHLHLGCRPRKPDIHNGYRGFIDPCKVLVKEEDMITQTGLNYIMRLLYGRSPTQAEKDKYVGKIDFDSVAKIEESSPQYKEHQKQIEAAKKMTNSHFPNKLR